MAVTRREYIFSAFLLGVLCVLLTVVAISSDSWVISTAAVPSQTGDNVINYGLFRGEFEVNVLVTPTINVLYMTCVAGENACAVSCKTTGEARENEVRALAQGLRPNVGCNADASITTGSPLDPPPVISMALYACLLLLVFLQLLFAVLSSALAIINATRNPTEPIFGLPDIGYMVDPVVDSTAVILMELYACLLLLVFLQLLFAVLFSALIIIATRNPTEPIFGLPGCLWSNAISAVIGVIVLMMFGIYWAVSGLKDHLAFSDVAQGSYSLNQGLGYSYWLLIAAVLCSACNVGLIELRRYLLERDPPPPTIKVENHSDGTIFLY